VLRFFRSNAFDTGGLYRKFIIAVLKVIPLKTIDGKVILAAGYIKCRKKAAGCRPQRNRTRNCKAQGRRLSLRAVVPDLSV
jgi:hypothetical protein